MIFFDPGRAVITHGAAPILDNAAAAFAFLLSCEPPGVVVDAVYLVAGHSDRTGSASSNRRLSCARARAARAYLVTRGISPEQLIPVGYGEERPNVPTSESVAEPQNRFVEISLMVTSQVAENSAGALRC